MVKLDLVKQLKEKVLGYKHKKFLTIIISLPIPFVIAIITHLLGFETTTVISATALGLVLVFIPYMVISFLEFREIRNAEASFPNFLRDLAQGVSAGMTLPQAIKNSGETDYGSLSKYIKKLNIWLSWGKPFPEAWKRFTDSLRDSELVTRINGIILEAFYTGGEIKVTLNSLAEDVNLLKQMEQEKKSIMQQQIIIMYVIYFIFVGVIIGLFRILSPILFIQKLGTFSGIAIASAEETLTLTYFKDLFFIMTIIESVCAGLLAGQISEEKLVAGSKHVFIMLGVGIFLFFLFIFPSQLSFEVAIYPSVIEGGEKIIITGRAFYESAPASGATITIFEPGVERKIQTVFVDNLGEFKRTIEAPSIPGEYDLVIAISYEGQQQSTSRRIKVL